MKFPKEHIQILELQKEYLKDKLINTIFSSAMAPNDLLWIGLIKWLHFIAEL